MMKITLNLTVEEVNVVLAGLGKLPLETGIAVFELIKIQAQSQLQPAPETNEDTQAAEPPIAA